MDRLQQGLGTAGRATAQLISSGWKTTKQTTTKLQQQKTNQTNNKNVLRPWKWVKAVTDMGFFTSVEG